jgi:16S rRNA (guanine527-N7)-methyltransferase
MQPARIAELLQPFLSPISSSCHSERGQRPGEESAAPAPAPSFAQLKDISTYIDILMRWNARINLTAIRSEEEIITRHFGESFFAARHLFPASAQLGTAARLADVGSGAGFPGIPLKLWAPEINLTLIESSHKKATFLREVIRALTLMDINVFHGRAEQLVTEVDPPQLFDVVTLRAVEHFAEILPVAARLVSPGGRLALLIGSSQIEQAQLLLPELTWSSPLDIPLSKLRTLLVGRSPVRLVPQE